MKYITYLCVDADAVIWTNSMTLSADAIVLTFGSHMITANLYCYLLRLRMSVCCFRISFLCKPMKWHSTKVFWIARQPFPVEAKNLLIACYCEF